MAKVNILKTKWFIILVSVALVALTVGLSVGLTASYWSDEGGGDTAVAPSGTTYNWNAYAKYFIYSAYDGSDNLISSNFHDGGTLTSSPSYFICTGLDNSSTLLGDVIFPDNINYKIGGTPGYAPLRRINNTIFNKDSYNEVPTKVVISPYITRVEPSTFANLPNLREVVISAQTSTDTRVVELGIGCFSNCATLEKVSCEGQIEVWMEDNAFLGCLKLDTVDRGNGVLKYRDTSTSTSTTLNSSTAVSVFSKVFGACPELTIPF